MTETIGTTAPSSARKPLPRLTNGDLGVRPFMIDIMRKRDYSVTANPSLIQTDPWATTKPYYDLRKLLDHLGYDIDERYPVGHRDSGKVILAYRRPHIQGKMLTDICENELGKKRHELGIFVDERTQFVYRGESNSVGFYDIERLVNKGTDIILAEKAYAVKKLAPVTQNFSIVLMECGGNFVEYARRLCEQAVKRGCNVAILTDFDISGIAMCLKIPWATRIGIDESTVYALELTENELREVTERYNADPGQMKFVTTTLDTYAKKGWIDGPLDLVGEGDYNIELIKGLMLGQRQAVRYLQTTRIELDHVIEVVGQERFFKWLKETMEERFPDRDYNYGVDNATVDEIRPPLAKEFVARMNKLFVQIPGLEPALKRVGKNLRNVEGLQPVDEERQNMLDELIKTEKKDPKVKRFLSKLSNLMNDMDLPQLDDEEKRNL